MTKPWKPTFLESRCLQQLDVAENWRILDREQPPVEEILPWKPFVRIFWFNWVVFGLLFAGIATGFALALDGPSSPFLGVAVLVGLAVGGLMAFGATNIYRKAWNRRAKSYLED